MGFPGLILGVPLTIGIRVLLLEGYESTRWLADLMSATVPDSPPAGIESGPPSESGSLAAQEGGTPS